MPLHWMRSRFPPFLATKKVWFFGGFRIWRGTLSFHFMLPRLKKKLVLSNALIKVELPP